MEADKAKARNGLDNVMYSYSMQTNVLEEENRILRETIERLKSEIDQFNQPALMVCEVHSVTGKNSIIQLPNGNMFYVSRSEKVKELAAGDQVLVEQKNLTIVERINSSRRFNVEKFVIIEKPRTNWSDIGGLDKQKEEIKEVIELPLKKPDLFRKVGILPPKGILLYGDPGTGKTLLAKAVATSTKATFIEIVGSELVQKFIGEGAKLVKEIFILAKAKAPSIIFIDEIDALASKRVEIGTSGEREVQRTFMQLLAEIDGFKNLGNVKIVACTNRRDILDPAVIRPGRLDRLIEVPRPEGEGIDQIFRIHTKDMSMPKLNMMKVRELLGRMSGAEIKAVATEAGYFAIRANRTKITEADLNKSIRKVKEEKQLEGDDYMRMFG